MAGDFRGGSFYFPTVTGDFDVVVSPELPELGLAGPQGIFFFGGNQPDEDTLVHPTAPGLFFGVVWTDVGSGLVDAECQAQTTYGVRWVSQPICSLSTGTTVEYAASAVTFNPQGFTLTVSTAAPGVRLVHYLLWANFLGAEGGTYGGTSLGQVFDQALDYRAFSAFVMSMFSSGASRDGSAADALYLSLGGACFPRENTALLNDNVQAMTFRSPGTTSEGFTQDQHQVLDDGVTLGVHSGPAGTYLDDVNHLRPYPNWDSEALRLTLYGSPDRSEMVWWDCEADVATVSSPDVAAVSTYTAPSRIDEIQAALFFGTTGYGSEEQLGVNYAYTLGFLTPDAQGVVAFDTGHGNAPADGTLSFFQSQAACLAACLSPGGGIRVSSGEILANQVKLTGEIASNTSFGWTEMMVWGKEGVWRPQIYRRILSL